MTDEERNSHYVALKTWFIAERFELKYFPWLAMAAHCSPWSGGQDGGMLAIITTYLNHLRNPEKRVPIKQIRDHVLLAREHMGCERDDRDFEESFRIAEHHRFIERQGNFVNLTHKGYEVVSQPHNGIFNFLMEPSEVANTAISVPAHGVSMFDAAILFEPDDKLARSIVDRWQRTRETKPNVIGYDPVHKQVKLYAPPALCTFLLKIERNFLMTPASLLSALNAKARLPSKHFFVKKPHS